MKNNDVQHSFEDEIFFSLRAQRNKWARTAMISMGVAGLALFSLVLVLPLKDIRPYVVLVDKTTGEAEKVVEVRPASLEQQEVVLQAELVSYVSDRETYDMSDSVTRITDVMSRSKDQAADSLAVEWDSSSSNYPPKLYGVERVVVTIKSVSITPSPDSLQSGTASVRLVKRREASSTDFIERSYIATVGYKFEPTVGATLESVWKNPLGFTVLTYRLDAEVLETAKK